MITKIGIARKLKDPEYRSGFAEAELQTALPLQIRALMKARGWTQAQLAEHAGMKQSRISALQRLGSANINLTTLLRLAETFDCGLLVRFVSFDRLLAEMEEFDPDNSSVPPFNELDREVAPATGERLPRRPHGRLIEFEAGRRRLYGRRDANAKKIGELYRRVS